MLVVRIGFEPIRWIFFFIAEGLVYIKQLDAKYDKQLEAEKAAVPVVEVKTTGGRKNAKRKLFKFNF